jgi:hypothetical protein
MGKPIETTTLQNEEWRTYMPASGVQSRSHKYETPLGYDVWRWPEFQALIKRLGVDVEAPITCVTLSVPYDDVVVLTQEFHGLDLTKEMTKEMTKDNE